MTFNQGPGQPNTVNCPNPLCEREVWPDELIGEADGLREEDGCIYCRTYFACDLCGRSKVPTYEKRETSYGIICDPCWVKVTNE